MTTGASSPGWRKRLFFTGGGIMWLDRLSIKRWGKVRRMGLQKFMLIFSMAYSTGTTVVYLAITRYLGWEADPNFEGFLIGLVYCYGPVWAWGYWHEMERLYRKGDTVSWRDILNRD
jgi:hypothetical protein